jgi:hypothetical protein
MREESERSCEEQRQKECERQNVIKERESGVVLGRFVDGGTAGTQCSVFLYLLFTSETKRR